MHKMGGVAPQPVLVTDAALSQRLERAEAAAGARFVETRARMSPESGAEWIEVAGAYAMYDGPRSPITQTFGLGMFEPARASDLDTLEKFFRDRGAPVFHEVSPMADKALLGLLPDRGYRPVELTAVMYQPIRDVQPTPGEVTVRIAGPDEYRLWAEVAMAGWADIVEFSDLMMDLMTVCAAREDSPSFLAEFEGRAIAAGSLCLHAGVALLAGACTRPEARNRGAQRALLEARLGYARSVGCDIAMMCAEPGSGSQRNAERQGFRIAYTRIKWGLLEPSASMPGLD
jgi:GNAT superfamily N-acetyltransferase